MTRKPLFDLMLLGVLLVVAMSLLWHSLSGRFSGNQNYDFFCCYAPVAHNLIDGKGFAFDNKKPAVLYPPGFSLLLAGVFESERLLSEETALNLFIIVCMIATVWALYWGTYRLLGRRHALLTALLWLTFPFFLWLSKQPNSETPFLAFLVGSVCCYFVMWSGRRPMLMAALAGLLAGGASLMRASGILVGVIMAVVLVLFVTAIPLKRRIVLASVMVAINLVAVLPWEIWAYQATGKVIPLADFHNGYWEGVAFGALPTDAGGVDMPLDPGVRSLMERGRDRTPRVGSLGDEVRFVLDEWQISRPAVLRFLWMKVTRPWYATHGRWFETLTMVIEGIYLALAIAGLWILRKAQTALCVLLVLITLYFWALATLVMPLLRYMTPPMALLMIPVAAAIRATGVWQSVERRFIAEV